MKYIKLGFGAIAAQIINAKCCCGDNDNNNNNGGENNKSEEDIFVDEIVEFFKVTKDRVIIKKKITAKDAAGYYAQNFLTLEESKTVKKEFSEAQKSDKDLELYQFTKLNLKSKKSIYVTLISKNISPDMAKLEIYNQTNLPADFTSCKEIDIYSMQTGTCVFSHYTKKKS